MWYSHLGNVVPNGTISITQWGFISDYYKVIGQWGKIWYGQWGLQNFRSLAYHIKFQINCLLITVLRAIPIILCMQQYFIFSVYVLCSLTFSRKQVQGQPKNLQKLKPWKSKVVEHIIFKVKFILPKKDQHICRSNSFLMTFIFFIMFYKHMKRSS